MKPGVLVIRHGLTQWNTDHRWQGWADIPLSDVGHHQAAVAARALVFVLAGREPLRIVSSDLSRAYETARAFAVALGVPEVEQHVELRERHVGDWSGLTVREINQRWPGMLDDWRSGTSIQLPGGEHEDVFRDRIFQSFSTIVEEASLSGVTTVLVSHGGAIRTIESLLHIESRPVANVSGRWFFWDGKGVVPGDIVDLLESSSVPDPGRSHVEQRSTGTSL